MCLCYVLCYVFEHTHDKKTTKQSIRSFFKVMQVEF